MGLFNTHITLADSGFLRGYSDFHAHLLPGFDDGIKDFAGILPVLSRYEAAGVIDVWLTPHIMEDIPNTTADLRARYSELQEAYSGSVKLHLAAENMIDNLFNESLAAKDFLPIGPNGTHLLVETSYYQPPIDLYGTLKRIQEEGYIPILAHPERYGYMDDRDYDKLSSMRVKLQMNIVSLAGGYGKPAQDKAIMLLNKGYYSFFGSDLHRLRSFTEAVNMKAIKKEFIPQLQRIENFIPAAIE